jgi:hypothetical protein
LLNYNLISYPNAGHFYFLADRGPRSVLNVTRFGSFGMVFGGTPEGDAAAAQAVRIEGFHFLETALARVVRH